MLEKELKSLESMAARPLLLLVEAEEEVVEELLSCSPR
jgi:hypothetical protein